MTAGQVIYKDAADSRIYKTDANGTAAQKAMYGIALNGGAVAQPVSVLTAGPITIGATVVLATIYIAGATAAGDINPAADLASGWQTMILGVATSASVINVTLINSGVALA